MKRLLSSLAVSGLIAIPASAHDFWLVPSAYMMEDPGQVRLGFQIGHGTEKGPWNLRWDKVVGLRSISDDGWMDHQATVMPRSDMMDGGAVVALDVPGTHMIVFDSYNQDIELEAEKFNGYIESEGLTAIIDNREAMGKTGEPGTELYSRRGKTLVQVGDTFSYSVMEPIGQTLEIVPKANPYALGEDEMLPVQVRFRGAPLEGALIDLTDLETGVEPMASELTDADGMASFAVPQDGSYKLNVIWGVPMPENDAADYLTVFTSLTFGYPEAE